MKGKRLLSKVERKLHTAKTKLKLKRTVLSYKHHQKKHRRFNDYTKTKSNGRFPETFRYTLADDESTGTSPEVLSYTNYTANKKCSDHAHHLKSLFEDCDCVCHQGKKFKLNGHDEKVYFHNLVCIDKCGSSNKSYEDYLADLLYVSYR